VSFSPFGFPPRQTDLPPAYRMIYNARDEDLWPKRIADGARFSTLSLVSVLSGSTITSSL
jgi:hypothetical protein